MGRLISLLFLCLSPFGELQSQQQLTFSAKVIRIIDGDTMEVLKGQQAIKVRLLHIDCPEKKKHQPFATQAKQGLSDLCFGQTVKVQGNKFDRYHRLLAEIINARGQNANQEMIKKGLAWHYKKYSTDKTYALLEINARKQKVGLWQEANPTPPWEWRRPKKKQSS